MPTSPLHCTSTLPTVCDIFDRLLQCERLLTARELAAILNIKPKTIYSYAERNLIPSFKIESNVRFCGSDVAKWLRQRGGYGTNRSDMLADGAFRHRAEHRASL
ncbi:MAG: helix-turn-helix domain-containing protein [Bryobacteraceae bacterium]